VNLLLDTHVLLWIVLDDPRLKPELRTVLASGSNRISVSLASLWEIGIKLAQGRLQLPGNDLSLVLEFMREWRMQLLPVTLVHVRAAATLPFHHGDPFDRMLIAQANTDMLRLVSKDSKMRLYSVDIFW
jgi:PIN domain nuclease of toxin-antitoxin system